MKWEEKVQALEKQLKLMKAESAIKILQSGTHTRQLIKRHNAAQADLRSKFKSLQQELFYEKQTKAKLSQEMEAKIKDAFQLQQQLSQVQAQAQLDQAQAQAQLAQAQAQAQLDQSQQDLDEYRKELENLREALTLANIQLQEKEGDNKNLVQQMLELSHRAKAREEDDRQEQVDRDQKYTTIVQRLEQEHAKMKEVCALIFKSTNIQKFKSTNIHIL